MFEHALLVILVIATVGLAFYLHIIVKKHAEEMASIRGKNLRSLERAENSYKLDIERLTAENHTLEYEAHLKEVRYEAKISNLKNRLIYLEMLLKQIKNVVPNIEETVVGHLIDDAVESGYQYEEIDGGSEPDEDIEIDKAKDRGHEIDYHIAKALELGPIPENFETISRVWREYEEASDEEKSYITCDVGKLKEMMDMFSREENV